MGILRVVVAEQEGRLNRGAGHRSDQVSSWDDQFTVVGLRPDEGQQPETADALVLLRPQPVEEEPADTDPQVRVREQAG